jgi:hypothetical protein
MGSVNVLRTDTRQDYALLAVHNVGEVLAACFTVCSLSFSIPHCRLYVPSFSIASCMLPHPYAIILS